MSLMLTWNMQGGQGSYDSKWQALAGRIQRPAQYDLPERPAIVFLQECSDVPGAETPQGWGQPPANITAL
ncbi:hypothetical protein CCR85_04755 [Rhodothalassium salexigens]|uniref:hypothetical protein n=1 Tax=Rhodothalassium salexigens TaxID=1086 RepID=UPI001912EA22|nr:hypothetical protein [Rhodothalassium salexigens]MBK5910802.1 hypothetical protein [Rhodothalassium salexigens]MBK5920548.1 hypothetical protein [Rhodothalassium salexigens]